MSSGKIDKYDTLTDKEEIPSDQRRAIEQAQFTYSSLGKVFKKQRKTIEDQGRKQIDAITHQNEKVTPLTLFWFGFWMVEGRLGGSGGYLGKPLTTIIN